jgi:hypothetical protein
LGVVGLIESTAGDLHDARVLVGQIDLIFLLHSTGWGLGRAAAGLPSRALFLLCARGQLGLMFNLLARKALLRSRLDLRLRLGDRRQTQLPSLELLRDRHPVGNIGGIRPLGQSQQLLHFLLQLLLDPFGVTVGQRTVPARIGVNLRAIQPAESTRANREKVWARNPSLDAEYKIISL